ncbi:3D domain-containing protein [Nanoarchaeota archaeon]
MRKKRCNFSRFRYRILYSKKATEESNLLWRIALVVAAAMMFLFQLNFIAQVSNTTIFEKNFLARDLSILYALVQHTPGNVVVDYPEKLTFTSTYDRTNIPLINSLVANRHEVPFTFTFGKNIMSVSITEDDAANTGVYNDPPVRYFYPQNTMLTSPKKSIKPEERSLYFLKTGNFLDVGEDTASLSNKFQLYCIFDTPKEEFTENSVYLKSNAISNIKDIGIITIKTNFFTFMPNEKVKTNVFIETADNKAGSTIKAYVLKDQLFKQTRQTACLIVNSIMAKSDFFVSAKIVPIKIGEVPDDPSWEEFSKSKNAIYIELDNKGFSKDKEKKEMRAVFEGLVEGFESHNLFYAESNQEKEPKPEPKPSPTATPTPQPTPQPQPQILPGEYGNLEDTFSFPEYTTSSAQSYKLWATNYNLPQVQNVDGGISLRDMSGNELGPVLSLKDWCDAAMEGSVRVIDSKGSVTYNYAGTSSTNPVDCRKFFDWDVSRTKFKIANGLFGDGVQNYILVSFRTIAVDKNVIPFGSVIYIPDARGIEITLPDGRSVTHDGYFFAGDTGGAIKQTHIDVFIGVAPSNPFSWIKSNENGIFNAYKVTDEKIIKALTDKSRLSTTNLAIA